MNQRHRASSSSLFLMELILAILFFCIASTICVSIFARSHSMNVDSKNLNSAVSEASNIAEIISSTKSIDEVGMLLMGEYEGMEPNGTGFILKDFDFEILITLEMKGELLYSNIKISDSKADDIIYELDVTHYISERTVPDDK